MRVGLSPHQVLLELSLNRLCSTPERQLANRQIRRHEPEHIGRTDGAREEIHNRLLRVVRTGPRRVRVIEIDHEHAVVRVLRNAVALGLATGIAPIAIDGIGLDLDELEFLDFLGFPVFEYLKIPGREPFDELAVAPRIRVHGDEIDAGAEHRRRLRGPVLRRGLAQYGAAGKQEHGCDSRKRARSGPMRDRHSGGSGQTDADLNMVTEELRD